MSDCQHNKFTAGTTYNINITGSFTCGICSAPHPTRFMAKYIGHELEAGQMCAAWDLVSPIRCGCGEMIRRFWGACGDGWTSDLFTRQSEPVEIPATRQPAPADTERTEPTR